MKSQYGCWQYPPISPNQMREGDIIQLLYPSIHAPRTVYKINKDFVYCIRAIIHLADEIGPVIEVERETIMINDKSKFVLLARNGIRINTVI